MAIRRFGALVKFFQGEKKWAVEAQSGERLMDLANTEGEIFGYCKGQLACTTCRVYIPKQYARLLPPASALEEDVLCEHPYSELYPEKLYIRRMSCQLKTSPQLHGLRVYVPAPFLTSV